MKIHTITGIITTEDGCVREFTIRADGTYMQWGSSRSIMGDSQPIVEAMRDALVDAELAVDVDELVGA